MSNHISLLCLNRDNTRALNVKPEGCASPQTPSRETRRWEINGRLFISSCGMGVLDVAIFLASNRSFFRLRHNTNCQASDFVACDDVDQYFDIWKAEESELLNVGLGVKMSKLIIIKRRLRSGDCMFSSVSHIGMLAIHTHFNKKFLVQFTNLETGERFSVSVEGATQTGFYDNSLVMLTFRRQLRVCTVDDMSKKRSISALHTIGTEKVSCSADITLLHSTRLIVYKTISNVPFEFNVDTHFNKELKIEKQVDSFASLTGIDMGIKAAFMEWRDEDFVYSVGYSSSTNVILKQRLGFCSFDAVIPSSTSPRNLDKALKIFDDGTFYISEGVCGNLEEHIGYRFWQSIVRLYGDVFLAYSHRLKHWCLVKILVP